MFLTSVANVRTQLGFDDMDDINLAIESALHSAEFQISGMLNTSLRSGSSVDSFYLYEPTFRQGTYFRSEVRLRHGFIRDTTTNFGSFTWDTEKGVGFDTSYRFDVETLEVTYDYGFEADESNPDSFDLSVVPSWLQEAGRICTLINLADNPSLTKAEVKLDKEQLRRSLRGTLALHLRYAPTAILPI